MSSASSASSASSPPTTNHVELGSLVSLYLRTPTLIAMTAAGLDAVSGGRFVLGLGASGPQVVEGCVSGLKGFR
jgi:alkanesulfonate monooxygenase SsuD/methylene tetrahydromethanopterin reductase-like flavin-dependent oxidoreductase (luciferase family)